MVFLNNFNQDVVNDIENPLDENRLMNFSQFNESNSKKAYYIAWSSWFDMNPYDIDKMKEVMAMVVKLEAMKMKTQIDQTKIFESKLNPKDSYFG